MSKAGDICPHCGIHLLKEIKSSGPNEPDYLHCTYCNSTFVIE